MPCWTVREIEVDWKVANLDLLYQALAAEGLNPTKHADRVTFSGGYYVKGETTLHIEGYDEQAMKTRINKAYSAAIVQNNMRRMGWTMQKNEQGKMAFIKR